MRDIFNAGDVKIQIDEFGKRIWVCVDGVTVLRCARIKKLEVQDDRIKLEQRHEDELFNPYPDLWPWGD